MFLQLYNRSHEKVAGLAVAKAAQIESVLSTGDKTLSFSYPLNQAAGLINEAYLRTETDEFVIKEVLPDSTNAWVSVKAVLNVETLQGQCWPKFESVEQKIGDSLTLAIAGTGWTIGSCTVTKRRTIRKTGCSTWEIISQARKTYNCDIWFDSLEKKIHIAEKRGQDKGVYFTDNLNLKRLAIQSTSYDFCTRIRAEGKDGLTFADINGGKNYVENHQYSDKNLEIYWKDERYTVAESLKEDAEAKLNELSKPVVAYSGDILDLVKARPKTYRILDYGLGDTVELVDSTTGTKEKQRIVKIVEYPDEPEKNTCAFANCTASFEELQQEQNEVNSTVNNITADDGTISPSALDLDAITIHVQNIYAQELSAVKARIGELETTTLKATEAIINTAMIEELLSKKATILDLNALTARVEVAEIKVGYVDTLVSDVADIKTLVNGNLTSVNIQAGGITSDSLTIRNGFITNAMIGSVEAGKITTGILNTSLVTIQGADGRMDIKDNTIQIKDANCVRVQIGKDAAGDYSMYVWDANGALMFDAAGLHAPGIKSGIIRNDMVADNAGIAGTKIDIVSLITSINGNTTKIDSTVIKMDSSGQTLNLAFNTLKTTAETAKSTTETHATQINAINGKIDTLIQDTTIVRDGQTVKLKDEYNKTVATVGGIQTTIGNQQTTIANLTNDLNNLSIGGRNLLKDTISYASWSLGNCNKTLGQTDPYGGNKAVLISGNTQANSYILKAGQVLYKKGYHTLSVWLKGTKAGQVYVSFNNGGSRNMNAGKLCTLTTEWQQFEITENTTTLNTAYAFVLGGWSSWTDLSLGVYMAFPMLTEGNKAMPWTPAPEDTQGQITEVKTQQATFEQTLKGFSTTVSNLQTTVNGKADGSAVNTLSNRITAMETNLDGFKTTVSNTYTTKTDFNNLSVGGRNYYKKTTPISLSGGAVTIDRNNAECPNGFYTVGIKEQTGNWRIGNVITSNGYWTISFEVRGSQSASVGFYLDICDLGMIRVTTTADNTWKKVEHTVNVTNHDANPTTYNFVDMSAFSWAYFYIRNIKIEKGQKATDWTPAPEDVDASITAVDSKFASYSTTSQMNSAIDQKANQITQTVSQTYTTKTEFSNLQIGVRNILRNSGGSSANANYNTRNYETSNLKPNTKYTFVINGFTSAATQQIGVWFNGGSAGGFRLPATTTAKTQYIVVTTPASLTTTQVSIYNYPSGSTRCVINWAAMYEGDIRPPMDWTPAKEDTDSYIDGLTTRMSTAEQKITPTAITNAVTSAINGGQASFQTASMTLTSTGLTVDASKFIVRYGGVDLMKLEAANSQLSLRATLQQYNKSTGYKGVEVVDNKIQFYDHTLNGNFVGGISSVVKSTTQDQPGMSVYYDEPDRLGLGYKRTSDGKIIHSMELRNKTININEVTNFSTTVYFNGPGPWMPDVHGKGGFALTLYSNQYIVCRQEANNSIYIPIWAGGFNTGSSRATKDNIVPIQDGSSIIRRSEICSYNLKADLQQGNYIKKYGLIAEDAPDEVVTQDRKAIDLYSMVSIGWKATQEIILENDLRDAKIEHLQREIGELKSKIWQMEQRLSVA